MPCCVMAVEREPSFRCSLVAGALAGRTCRPFALPRANERAHSPRSLLCTRRAAGHSSKKRPPPPPPSGFSVDVALFPIDTIKTRLQAPQGFVKAGGFNGVYNGIGSLPTPFPPAQRRHCTPCRGRRHRTVTAGPGAPPRRSAAAGSMPGAALFFCTYDSARHALAKRHADGKATALDAVVRACAVGQPSLVFCSELGGGFQTLPRLYSCCALAVLASLRTACARCAAARAPRPWGRDCPVENSPNRPLARALRCRPSCCCPPAAAASPSLVALHFPWDSVFTRYT